MGIEMVAVRSAHADAEKLRYQHPLSGAALALGIAGLLLTPVPFEVGLIVGGVFDLLAIVFGMVALLRYPLGRRHGTSIAVVGLVFGTTGVVLITVGAGTAW
jgi:hypothetical protein